jgi:hypothetical protein
VRETGPEIPRRSIHSGPLAGFQRLPRGGGCTARAGAEWRLREALRARGEWGADVPRVDARVLIGAALQAGVIDKSIRNAIDNRYKRLSEFVNGRRTDRDQLQMCIDALAAACSTVLAAAEPVAR